MPRRESSRTRRYYYDSETWGLNPSNAAFIIVMPERAYSSKMPEEWVFMTDDDSTAGAKMRAWIDSLPKSYRHILYAHNGSKFDIYSVYETAQAVADIPKVASDSTIYTFRVRPNVELRDSLHLLNRRAADLGAKGITPQKFIDETDLEYGNMDSISQEDLDYCRQDIIIIRDAIVGLKEEYRRWTGIENAGLPLTSASLAYRTWCARSWPDDWHYGKTFTVGFPDAANECARGAYYGGRTEVFPGLDGVTLKNVMSFDRNSMYPSEMVSQVYPDPAHVYAAAPRPGRVHRLIRAGTPFWGRFRLRATPGARLFLPTIIDGKADYRQTWYEGPLMYPEVIHALNSGWVLESVSELWRSRPMEPFKEHVEFFYDLRLQMKARGDPAELFVKVGPLNSLYGKFGSKDRAERIEDPDTIKATMAEEGWKDRWEVKSWSKHSARFYLVSKTPNIRSNCTFFPWAAAVTSYARVNLQKTIEACEDAGFRVAYTDTDSVHVYDLKDEMPPIPLGRNLGEWDLESPKGWEGWIPEAIYWERKAYLWTDDDGNALKVRHKGVPHSDGDLTKEHRVRRVMQYREALRRSLPAGREFFAVRRSKRWFNERR